MQNAEFLSNIYKYKFISKISIEGSQITTYLNEAHF